MHFFMPLDQIIGDILFLSCLFVCLSVCLSVVNFNIRYNFWTIGDKDYSTNNALSNDTKVNDFDLCTKNGFLDLLPEA